MSRSTKWHAIQQDLKLSDESTSSESSAPKPNETEESGRVESGLLRQLDGQLLKVIAEEDRPPDHYR
jgi:hypothetical protein